MLADQPPRPANMRNIVAINQGRRPHALGEPVSRPLDPLEAARRLENGGLALDTRPAEAFRDAHVAGAYSVPQSSDSFEQYVGWILPEERPLVLVVEEPAAAATALRKLAFVGLEGRVEGFVTAEAWRAAGLPLAGLPQIDVATLHGELARGGLRVLDVREVDEWRAGRLEPSLHLSFKLLPSRLERLGLAPQDRLAVLCAGGLRSTTACSVLRSFGFTDVLNVTGGINAWREAGYPLSDEAPG